MWISLWKESEAVLGFDPEWSGGLGHLMTVFNVLIDSILRELKGERVHVSISVEVKRDVKEKEG